MGEMVIYYGNKAGDLELDSCLYSTSPIKC